MPGVLVAFHKGALHPCSSGGKEERRVEGRSAFLSPPALEGCRLWLQNGGNEGRPKPLQTRRPRLANALSAQQQAEQKGLRVHRSPLKQRSNWPKELYDVPVVIAHGRAAQNHDCKDQTVIVRKT